MKRLSNREIRNICDEIITTLEQRSSVNLNFLCMELIGNLYKRGYKHIYEIKPHIFIPKFTMENAIEHANASKPELTWYAWWEHLGNGDDKTYFNFDDRIKFMKWLKEQYTPKKSFYKWLLNICNRINF